MVIFKNSLNKKMDRWWKYLDRFILKWRVRNIGLGACLASYPKVGAQCSGVVSIPCASSAPSRRLRHPSHCLRRPAGLGHVYRRPPPPPPPGRLQRWRSVRVSLITSGAWAYARETTFISTTHCGAAPPPRPAGSVSRPRRRGSLGSLGSTAKSWPPTSLRPSRRIRCAAKRSRGRPRG